jgi:hypothetical protein
MAQDDTMALTILRTCEVLGIRLTPEGDMIRPHTSGGGVTAELLTLIHTHTPGLLTLLRREEPLSHEPVPTPDPIIPGPWTGPGFGGPCALCGLDDRWQDKYGILRCRACWPPDAEHGKEHTRGRYQ